MFGHGVYFSSVLSYETFVKLEFPNPLSQGLEASKPHFHGFHFDIQTHSYFKK